MPGCLTKRLCGALVCVHSGSLLEACFKAICCCPDYFVQQSSSCQPGLPRSTCLPRGGLSTSLLILTWLSEQQGATLVRSMAISFFHPCFIAHVCPEALFGPMYVLIYSPINIYSFRS